MLKQRITEAVKSILNSDFGFDIYIVMKSGDSLLKRFILEEGNPNEQGGFKSRICESIKDTIQNKFLSEESLYAGEDDLANEQNRFYVIRQNEQYRPFEFLVFQRISCKISDSQIKTMQMQFCSNSLFREMAK